MVDVSDVGITLLIRHWVERFVDGAAVVLSIATLPIEQGASGADIGRVRVTYSCGAESADVDVVLKRCSPLERGVLAHLGRATPRHVPLAVMEESDNGGIGWVGMQDLGNTTRPDSLSPLSPRLRRLEAEALADIHADNRTVGGSVQGLPEADRDYYHWAIERQFFRPAWCRSATDRAFRRQLAWAIDTVEAVAETIVDAMVTLSEDERWCTLIHTDINPSNVLVYDGQPYFIDWDTARTGPLFLDVPHHFCTRSQAEHYRLALVRRGFTIESAEFTRAYRVAAQYTGLRYIWWTLQGWDGSLTSTRWVDHYLQMIVQ